MLDQVFRYLESRERAVDCALDVGCATGEFTDLLSRFLPVNPSRRVIGVDLSATAIKRAMTRFPRLEFRVGALAELPQDIEKSVDLLCCLEVLYYLSEEERLSALEGFASMMKPASLLLVSCMVGTTPYLNYPQLCNLIGRRFNIVASNCLNLWPLASFEKAFLTIPWLRPQLDIAGFLPGRSAFNMMRSMSRISGRVFGERAHSHAYVLAEPRS
jgi:SAM-dependent methyltransferase